MRNYVLLKYLYNIYWAGSTCRGLTEVCLTFLPDYLFLFVNILCLLH